MNTDKVVIDSSVAIKWFIAQDYSLEANKILDAYQSQQITLIAPDLIYAEIGNIVWKIQRFQGLTHQDAEMIIDLFQQIQLKVFRAIVTPSTSLNTALNSTPSLKLKQTLLPLES